MYATSTQIRAFTAVAQERSFAKAAKKLGVTQPAVTLQVRALEDAYGVVLFDRRGAEIKMTSIGRDLFSLTHQIRNLEDEVDDLLKAQYDLVSGSLTIATGSPQITMELVSQFQRRHPQCRVDVSIGNHRFVWEEMLERRADFAIDTGIPRDERIVVMPFITTKIVVLVPLNHPLAEKKLIQIKEVGNERLIIRSDESITQEMVKELFRKANVALNPAMYVGSREAVHEAVAADLGIGFVLDREVVGRTRVTTVELDRCSSGSVESILCLKAQARRRLVKAFLSIARELQSPEAKRLEKVDRRQQCSTT